MILAFGFYQALKPNDLRVFFCCPDGGLHDRNYKYIVVLSSIFKA